MRKKIIYILCGVLIFLLCLSFCFIQKSHVCDKYDLSVLNLHKIYKIVDSEPEKSAEMINNLEDEEVSNIAIEEVLDTFYVAEELDTDSIEVFSEVLEEDITDLISNYEEAREERDNADNLDYSVSSIVAEFETNSDYDSKIREISNSYNVLYKDDEIVLVEIYLSLSQTTDMAIDSFEDLDSTLIVEKDLIPTVDSIKLSDTSVYKQWYLDRLGFYAAWDIVDKNKKQNVTVAVIDNGFNIYHKEIDDEIIGAYDPSEFVRGEYLKLSESSHPISDNQSGHGTACTSVVCAERNNYAMVGGSECSVMLFKSSDLSSFYKSVKYACDNDVQIITCSLSWLTDEEPFLIEEAIKYAKEHDVIIVNAAGNESKENFGYPAMNDYAISVGAVNRDLDACNFTNYGSSVNVLMAGEDIMVAEYSTESDSRIGKGTSYATPLVASVIAMMKEVNPNLTTYDIKKILYESQMEIGHHSWTEGTTSFTICPIGGELCKVTEYNSKNAIKKCCDNGHTYYQDDMFSCGVLNVYEAVRKAANYEKK